MHARFYEIIIRRAIVSVKQNQKRPETELCLGQGLKLDLRQWLEVNNG